MKHGYGIQISLNEYVYLGEFKDGLIEGYGLKKYQNNDEYDGSFINGNRVGMGQYTRWHQLEDLKEDIMKRINKDFIELIKKDQKESLNIIRQEFKKSNQFEI